MAALILSGRRAIFMEIITTARINSALERFVKALVIREAASIFPTRRNDASRRSALLVCSADLISE